MAGKEETLDEGWAATMTALNGDLDYGRKHLRGGWLFVLKGGSSLLHLHSQLKAG